MGLILLFGFLSGFATILAPCIWPILPIVLATSNGNKARSIGISAGIALSFMLFTLFLSFVLRILPVDLDFFRYLAVIILILLGVSLLVPKINFYFEVLVSKLSSKFKPVKLLNNNEDTTTQNNSNSVAAFLVKKENVKPINNNLHNLLKGSVAGLSIGSIWSPCAGPILASIAALTATERFNLQVLLLVIAYSIGTAIPLFALSLFGGKLVDKFARLNKYTAIIYRMYGLILIVMAVSIFVGLDKKITANFLNRYSNITDFLVKFENNKSVSTELDQIKKELNFNSESSKDLAPEIIGTQQWINSNPLTIKSLKGKVVLIDFWTYTCINCIRTLPYVTSWDKKYKDNGLVIIGVHTPEFEFEKKYENVLSAVKNFGINYPVVQDNNYATWLNYNNQYWPAKYLIDVNGNIRYSHFGEGDYDKTEEVIIKLLDEGGLLNKNDSSKDDDIINDSEDNKDSKSLKNVYLLTPETYLGTKRLERFASNELPTDGPNMFTIQDRLPLGNWGFAGPWFLEYERAVVAKSAASANLILHFYGKKVFLVMSAKDAVNSANSSNPEHAIKPITQATVILDKKVIADDIAGKDVKNGIVNIDDERLYELVSLKEAGDHELIINFSTQGIAVYAFTFGS